MISIKNGSYASGFHNPHFLVAVLKQLLGGILCRFVLQIFLFILPVVSYGQGLHTSDNILPMSGLENVYVAQQQKIEPLLFVASDAIISKSATATFFVSGSIQMDSLIVKQRDIINNPIPLPEKAPIKINRATEVAANDVKPSKNHPAIPYLPSKKNPLQRNIFCASVAEVFLDHKFHDSTSLISLPSLLFVQFTKEPSSPIFGRFDFFGKGTQLQSHTTRPPPFC